MTPGNHRPKAIVTVRMNSVTPPPGFRIGSRNRRLVPSLGIFNGQALPSVATAAPDANAEQR